MDIEQEHGEQGQSPFQQPPVASSIKELLNTDPMIINIRISLLRLEVNSQGRLVRKKVLKEVKDEETGEIKDIWVEVEPLINDDGFDMLMFHFISLITANISTSHLTDDEIRDLAEEFAIEISNMICNNYKKWNIKKHHFDMIIDTLDNNFFIFLKKARFGMTFKGMSQILTVGEKNVIQKERDQGMNFGNTIKDFVNYINK